MSHAETMQHQELREAASGDAAFDFCYRIMCQKDLPSTGSPGMGSQYLANVIRWLIEENRLPDDLALPSKKGPMLI